MTKLNRTTFLAYVRNAPFGGRLTKLQVEGMNAILDYWAASGLIDIRWLAYMLATVFHETGATMQPIREAFAKSDQQAIARLDAAWKAGRLGSVKTPYWRAGWFGRGLVQITHEINYKKMAEILGVPLDKKPQLALEMQIALAIMFEGMTKGASLRGDFTGKSLENYFNDTVDDPVGARKIINGTDKAKLIATYHRNFLDALKKAEETYIDDGRKEDYIAPDVNPEDAKPDNVPVAQSRSIWAIIMSVFGGGGLGIAKEVMDGGSSLLGAVSNPFALIAFLAVLCGGGVLVWLLATGRITVNRSKAVVS